MADTRPEALAQFASVARRCRAGAGYPDARAFYKALGGAAFFGCTYKAFANLEAGKGLPQPRLVEKMVAALRLPLRKSLAREFALAYLRLFLGSEEFLGLAVRAFSEDGPAAARAPRKELRLSARQAALLRGDVDSYRCFSILCNDRGVWDAESLAEVLDLPLGAVRKALGRLKAAGLPVRDAAGHRIEFPEGKEHAPEGGVSLMEHPLLLRASEAELRQYLPLLLESLRGAEDHAALAKGPDTALFLVRARIQKLVSF